MPEENFTEWVESMRSERSKLLEKLPEDDPLRFPQGHYEVAFSISDFGKADLNELRQNLYHGRPIFGGWPPFSFLSGLECRPMKDMIQTWAFEGLSESMNPHMVDYWCLSVFGQGYAVRPMEEDDPRYIQRVGPSTFNWVLPSRRMAEVLKFIEWFGLKYSSRNANFQLEVTYKGMKGRGLANHDLKFLFISGGKAHVDTITSKVSGPISKIALNVEELVFNLLKPIYSQFDFAEELPREVVNEVVKEAIRNQR